MIVSELCQFIELKVFKMILKAILICNIVICASALQKLDFPPGFKFGAATAAYQVEGAWNISDKTPSIWDNFVHTKPYKIKDFSNGDVACDTYRNWKRDIEMAGDLGLHFYRFSISWTRLMPTGFPNYISEDGREYYSNLIDALLAKNIEPLVTIYHWDLPQSLQDLGGWANPLVTDWFADYAHVVFSLYADRVKTWLTVNEPSVFCSFSYNIGDHAPGIVSKGIGTHICNKNVLLAHAKAWRIYDEEFKPIYHGRVSISHHHVWLQAMNKEEEDTAEFARDVMFGLYTYPIYSKSGGWPPAVEKYMKDQSVKENRTKSRLPELSNEEKNFIRGTYDFYGANFYTSREVRRLRSGETGVKWPMEGSTDYNFTFGINQNWEQSSEWFYVYPEAIRLLLNYIKNKYGDIEIVITENGFGGSESSLEDYNRIHYYEKHLEQVLLAIHEDSINVTGYTIWTLMDNFEWNFGYGLNFGLYQVDFKDPNRPRRPRASAEYYKQVIQQHSLNIHNKSSVLYYLFVLFITLSLIGIIIFVKIKFCTKVKSRSITNKHEGQMYIIVRN